MPKTYGNRFAKATPCGNRGREFLSPRAQSSPSGFGRRQRFLAVSASLARTLIGSEIGWLSGKETSIEIEHVFGLYGQNGLETAVFAIFSVLGLSGGTGVWLDAPFQVSGAIPERTPVRRRFSGLSAANLEKRKPGVINL